MIFGHVTLEPEQEELLCKFVEAERRVPKEQRGTFIMVKLAHRGHFIYSPSGIRFVGNPKDADILAKRGLIELSHYGGKGSPNYYVTPEGHQYYKEMKQSVRPTEAVEKEIRGYLSSDDFKGAYSTAFQKWSDAEARLWEEESSKQFTTIGLLCREALQEFVDALVRKYKPPDVDSNRKHTVNRLCTVLEIHSSTLGSKEKQFLKKLLEYWKSVSELVQRQVHGAEKEGEPLTLEDARRVVFQTCIVMYEVDRSLKQFQGQKS